MPDDPDPTPVEPDPEPAQDLPVYTAPLVDPPPNPGADPMRGEQGGDGG